MRTMKSFTWAILAALAISAIPAVTAAQGTTPIPITAKQWEGFTAEDWAATTAYATLGTRVAAGTVVYQLITAGTSGSATPTATDADVTDGTAHWKYLGTAAALGVDLTGTGGEVALPSGSLNAKAYDSITVVASATGTSSGRSLVVSCMAKDGTTSLFDFPAVTVAANAKALVVMRGDVTVPGTAPTGVTYFNVTPCPRIKASMAAISAGAGITATLAVYGRQVQGVTRPISVDVELSDAAGGALAQTVDATRLSSLQVLVEATTTNRALVVSCVRADSTTPTLFDYASLTVTAGAKFLRTFRFDSPTPGTEATNVLHIPVELCPRMKFSVAAAGAASAKLSVYGR